MSQHSNQFEKKAWLRRIEKKVYGAALYVVQDEPRAIEIAKAALLHLYRDEQQPVEGSKAERRKVLSAVFQSYSRMELSYEAENRR